MTDLVRTVIVSPAVDVVEADIEFHIGGGKVVFALLRARVTLTAAQAEAISRCIVVDPAPAEDGDSHRREPESSDAS